MSAGTVEAPARVAGALQVAREAVTAFQQQVAAAWMVPEDDLAVAVAEAGRLRAAVESGYLGLVREVVERGTLASIAGVAPGTSRVASSPEGVVRAVTGASPGRARADVSAAVATGPGAALEQFGAWLADGDVSREHVDVAVRVMDRIPSHLVDDPVDGPRTRAAVAAFLRTVTDDGRAGAGDVDRAGRRLLAHLDPDGRRSFDPNADQRRFLDLTTDATGMVVGRGPPGRGSGALRPDTRDGRPGAGHARPADPSAAARRRPVHAGRMRDGCLDAPTWGTSPGGRPPHPAAGRRRGGGT